MRLDLPRASRRCALALTAGAALLATALTGCASSSSGETSTGAVQSGLGDNAGSGPYLGAPLDPPRPRPAFTLTDATGARFDFAARTAGRPTLLYFGYTHCPDACPATMADIALALKSLPAALQKQTYVVFVTTDVKRDTGPVLTRWLHKFDGGAKATFVGLRGTQAQVDAAQASAHVFLASDGGAKHSAQLLLYGPDDVARDSFQVNSKEQEQTAHDLPLVVTE